MWSTYLSVYIKAQTESIKHDYDAMISYLAELEKRKKPGDSDLLERAESLLAIMNVILRVQHLKEHLPEAQGMAEVTSYSFLHRIRNMLCTADYLELSKDLVQHGLDARVASGPEALKVTLNQLRNSIAVLEPVVEKLRGKPRTKAVHTVDSSETENTTTTTKPVGYIYAVDSRLMSYCRWWDRDQVFPCPIEGHKHELTECGEFFTMNPKERQENSRGWICKTCFKPGGECLVKDKCTTSTPRGMVCEGCAKFVNLKAKRFSLHNILFCNNTNPAHAKPSRAEMYKILESYFKRPIRRADTGTQSGAGVFSCTRIGDDWRQCEPTHVETVCLTQWIKVGSKTRLVMYDRGSNINLATNAVAKARKSEMVSSQPKKITVAGGKTITLKPGVYEARLGPSITVDDKIIDCHRVKSITGNLQKQDLQEVNAELDSSGLIDQQLPLPKHAAGGDVSVLIGLQDVRLDPVLIAVLPSGIGVYRCTFKDIWGSQIATLDLTHRSPAPPTTAMNHRSS